MTHIRPRASSAILHSLGAILTLVCAAVLFPLAPSTVEPAEAAGNVPFIGLWTDGFPADITALDDLGVGWGRVTVRWSDVETASGVYTWTALDQAFAAVSGSGRRQTFATVRNNPAWAAASRCTIRTDSERAALARFVSVLVRRYSGAIPDGPLAGRSVTAKYWQFYNEMDYTSPGLEASIDLGGCFATAVGAEVGLVATQTGRDDYARMLEAVGPAVHTADPDGKVVMGGVVSSNTLSPLCSLAQCPFDPDFVRGVLQTLRTHGTLNRLDAVGVHYFSSQAPIWNGFGGPDLVGRILGLRQAMREAGLTDPELKPIFVDEGTYTNGPPASTSDPSNPYNRAQEAYATKALARAAYINVAGYFWFKRQDTLGPGLGGDWPFGLHDSNGAQKPSYRAYKYFASLVSRTNQSNGRLTLADPNFEGYQFTANDGRRFQVLWNEGDTDSISYTPNFGLGGQITDQTGASIAPVNHTTIVGAEPRFVFAPSCSPRPPIRLSVTPSGSDQLQVTVSASTSAGVPNNRISRLQFGTGSNSTIDVAGGPSGVTGQADLSLPYIQGTSFSIRRQNPSTNSATVPLTVTDDCGNWQTFVGGGKNAWTGNQDTEPPTLVVPTPSAPTAPVTCTPRPPVTVSSAPDGPGRLAVTIAATGPGNRLREIRVGETANATLDVGDRANVTGPLTVPLPATSEQTNLVLHRVTPNQPATAPLAIVDGCGEWPTLVGGGPDAF